MPEYNCTYSTQGDFNCAAAGTVAPFPTIGGVVNPAVFGQNPDSPPLITLQNQWAVGTRPDQDTLGGSDHYHYSVQYEMDAQTAAPVPYNA